MDTHRPLALLSLSLLFFVLVGRPCRPVFHSPLMCRHHLKYLAKT